MDQPRRSYYYKNRQAPSKGVLIARLDDLCLEFPVYGYRLVTRQLDREELLINQKKVSRIMREKGWLCRPRRKKWVVSIDSNHGFRVFPTRVKNIKIIAINLVWVAVITLYPHPGAWRSCGRSRRLSEKGHRLCDLWKGGHRSDPTGPAMAIHDIELAQGCIHHSDRCIQYSSADYVKELEYYGFQTSMNRKGNPYDNACAESFIQTLKSEEDQLWEYRTLSDVRKRIPYFIEDVYNQKRLSSSLGYRPPCEFEKMLTLIQTPVRVL